MNRLGLLLLTVVIGISFSRSAISDEPAAVPSFNRDVLPLLTKLGCNQGACHGKLAGQNGFRLSLRGFAPDWDHFWITREFFGRRISGARPEQSLLVAKPLGTVPHAGGRLLNASSREAQLLIAWLGAGSPGQIKDEATVAKLTLSSSAVVLSPNQSHALTVEAVYTDGRKRDVTWLTKFTTNDSAVAEVDRDGKLTALRSGETAIVAAFDGQVATSIVTIPFASGDQPERASVRFDPNAPAASALRLSAASNVKIDVPVFAKLAALRIEPAGLSSDEEFLRRVFLDTIGTLPTPAETRAFLADTSASKRARLIDELLLRPEFADFWTLQFADLFQNRKERDHDVRGTKGVRQFQAWLRKQVAANRPWDQLCRDILTAEGNNSENPAVGYFIVTIGEHGEAEKSEVVASVAQAFLGTRIGCAQCHNHPLERYTQDDYFHFAGYFSRSRFDRKPPEQGVTRLLTATGEGHNLMRERERLQQELATVEVSLTETTDEAKQAEFKKKRDEFPRRFADLDKRLTEQQSRPVGVGQPRTGQFLAARPLDRSDTPIAPGQNPRVVLANWITSPSNDFFSAAIANRLWKHFFRTGLVEPVDDLRATNPPSNPALMKSLQSELVASGFDLRQLMRLILNSHTYQLASATTSANATDTRFYSHYYARRLPAEVLLDAVSEVTAMPESFAGYPLGVRAIQLPDSGLNSYFLATFGRSERVTACACERQGEVTLPQLLQMQNGETILSKISAPQGRLAELLKNSTDDNAVVEELFVLCLARRPTAAEADSVRQSFSGDGPRDEKFRDLFWALLNSKEFAFNH